MWNKHIITCILIITLIIMTIMLSQNDKKYIEKYTQKPYLWLYWEGNIPDYVQLCIKSIKKHCGNSFEIVTLNDDLCQQYLGNLNNLNNLGDLKNIGLAQRSDYLSYRILHKYGGFWLDTNSIVMKDLLPLYNSMGVMDFVGFGCTGNSCKNGKPHPSVWALISKPNTKLMELCIEYSDKVIANDHLGYHDVGKYVLWKALDKLIKETGYDYVHVNDKYIGHRDKKGEWTCPLFTYSNNINIDPNDIYFAVLHGSHIKNWKSMSENDVMNHNSFAGSLLRKTLK